MPRRQKLSNDELLTLIAAEENAALGGEGSPLSADRAEALKRYHGEPFGDEMEGRSAVVSRDLSEAVDWIMPSLMRVFLTTHDVMRFDPVGPEDEKLAEQESEYVNHVITKQNNGFVIMHDWFKDALLERNGYVKHFWDTETRVTHESYSGYSEEEVALLFEDANESGDEIEIVGQEKNDANGTYDLRIRRTCKYGRVCIDVVPPEEIMISKRTRGNIWEAPFVEHATRKTRSELIDMGMDKDFVEDLPAWVDTHTTERIARDTTPNESSDSQGASLDTSQDEIDYREAYLCVDWDGDGMAEMRRIVKVGNEIPDGDKWNTEIDAMPFSDLTPNRMPHRHVGRSIQDELSDIAEIKTALWRALLDNTYGNANTEWLVNERVVLDDFLSSRALGIKRVQGLEPVLGAAQAVDKPMVIQHVLPVLDYVDTIKQDRSGVSPNTQGLDPDTLKQTTEGAARQALSQANLKIEMIARLFAETGVKHLVQSVHELLIKHSDKPTQFKLLNQWIEINPQEWRTRTDLTVNVGIGTGSLEESRSNALLLMTLQEQKKPDGIVTPRNSYNLAEKISNLLGFRELGKFFSDPNSPEAMALKQPPPPDPIVQAEQISAAIKAQIESMRLDWDKQKTFMTESLEAYKFEKQHALDIAHEEIQALIKGAIADIGKPGLGAETVTQDQTTAPIVEAVMRTQHEMAQGMQLTMQQYFEALMSQQSQMLSALIQQLARPKRLVHDKLGNPIGVETLQDQPVGGNA